MKKYGLVLLLTSFVLHADSGVWLPLWVDLYWDNNANWSGSSFPNGAGEVAAFIGQNPGTYPIDSTTDITIGALHFDAPGRSIFIDFSSNNLIFQADGVQNQANIFIAKEQTHFIDTPITLLSDLTIHAGTSASLYLNAPISGDHSISIFVDPNTHINNNIGHTYTGTTFVQSGWLDINGPANETNIPGDIYVGGSGAMTHQFDTENNYGPNSKMFIDGGNVDLNGTEQTLFSLEMARRGILRGALGSTLVLTSNTMAIKLREDSFIFLDKIIMQNGGVISNDPVSAGNGYLLGFVTPQGYTDIDLNNNSVVINAGPGSYEQTKDSLLDFANVHFFNGSLIKTGTGNVIFEGAGSIPNTLVLSGGIQIGRPTSPATIESEGTIDIESLTHLNGFGRLGNDGNASVVNGGYLIPGGYNESGTLTISGDYEQEMGGSILIQGLNESNVNTLYVEGDATLSGVIYFSALPHANFNPGDEVVLIDATGGSISGSFFFLEANLPEGLTASLNYTSDQVIMEISACTLE